MEAGGDHGSAGTGSCASVVLTTRAAQVLWRHGWPVDVVAGTRCSQPVSIPFSSRLPSGRWRADAAGQGRGSLSGRITDPTRGGPARHSRGRGRGAATALQRPITEYSEDMNESSSRSIGRMAVAALVLLIAVYVLLKIVLAIALAVALPVAVIAAVVAIIWAWRVLF